jgi:DNA-directed RNA polymerase subunit E'/Rpb7
VFRPFVDEVCIGTIIASNEQGLQVSLGFFDEIFIPAYWMLRPSHYEPETGLWVWVPPDYDAQGDEDNNNNNDDDDGNVISSMNETSEGAETTTTVAEQDNGFEMEIGSTIRFKVKALEFTQITKTAKGVQATTTTTSKFNVPNSSNKSSSDRHHNATNSEEAIGGPVRKRSSSVDLTNNDKTPPCFYIVASICEDGLGLTR